jgi:hypothetical protein
MHSCPECGSACYCSGDIDDIDVGDEEAQDDCTHCPEADYDDDDEDTWTDDEYIDPDLEEDEDDV